jgi:hypothetical protein
MLIELSDTIILEDEEDEIGRLYSCISSRAHIREESFVICFDDTSGIGEDIGDISLFVDDLVFYDIASCILDI